MGTTARESTLWSKLPAPAGLDFSSSSPPFPAAIPHISLPRGSAPDPCPTVQALCPIFHCQGGNCPKNIEMWWTWKCWCMAGLSPRGLFLNIPSFHNFYLIYGMKDTEMKTLPTLMWGWCHSQKPAGKRGKRWECSAWKILSH